MIDLEGDGALGEFQLVIARVSRGVKGGIERYTFTELIRRDLSQGLPPVVGSLKLFVGIFTETVD